MLVLALAAAQTPAFAALQGKTVEYKQGDTVLEGYLVYDDAVQGTRPGVVVVHEWKGLNDYAKRRADMLAQMGYVAFAADMYGKGVHAETHEEAGKLSGALKSDRKLMRERAQAALDTLKADPHVDVKRIAAIGYCFGGTTVLEMARAGFDLKGVASFHGALSTPAPAEKGNVKAKVIAFSGADDKFIPKEERDAFQKEMTEAGADWQFVLFSGAVHSFTVAEAGNDNSKGMAYNANADRRSWEMLKQFFNEIFSETPA
ncbi:MAG TPA: dienelactone hydrolase family protein [Verrucomicrobiae bacterium]|jgi:dienelactone hydrolase|nr:dienelactone hydrolase family protein [Verrucomicrobiae bacterium]